PRRDLPGASGVRRARRSGRPASRGRSRSPLHGAPEGARRDDTLRERGGDPRDPRAGQPRRGVAAPHPRDRDGAQGEDHVLRGVRVRAPDPRSRALAHAGVRPAARLDRAHSVGRGHVRRLRGRRARPLDVTGGRVPGTRSRQACGPRATELRSAARDGAGPHTFRVDPLDTLGRPLHDLRISVTDRCNFRCVYCMPKEVFGKDFQFLPRAEILTFEEIERLVRIFVSLGVQKIRLTGGEPLVRRDLEPLVEKLAKIGDLDLTLTTNGSLLSQKARALADAGLRRVTVSLDSLDDATFKRMNDSDFPVAKVLAGIEAAKDAGLAPIKINMVTKRGVNESSIVPMARYFKGTGMTLRFIEFMDVGSTNGWRLDDVVPARDIVAMIDREMPLEPVQAGYRGEVAARYRYKDGGGEIGVISSVTQPFCADCTRARLSADGALYTCLFATEGHDLRALLRNGASDDEITHAIAAVWTERTDRYSDLRSEQTAGLHKIEMSFIGG